MRFEAARWLLALAIIPVLWLVLVIDERRRAARAAQIISEKLWGSVIPEMQPQARLKKGIFALLALAFAFIALARPQWGQHEETAVATGLDIMLVLDVSNSMETEDIAPSRLKKAKHFVRSLMERLKGDRVGIVAFAGSAFLASPLTTDLEYASEVLQMLTPKSIANQGTDIGAGLDTAARALDRGSEDVKGESAVKAGTRVIILISDGEDHAEAFNRAAEGVRRSGNRLFVLGIGTERGGPVPVRDDNGQLVGHKKDSAGRPVVSTFHSDALSSIANSAGGRYWTMSQSESEIDELIGEMGSLARSEFEERHYAVYYERFQFPLALAIFFLLLELSVPARRLSKAAPVLAMWALAGGTSGCTDLPVYLNNEKALHALESKDLKEAHEAIAAAQARDPHSPPLRYNQGVLEFAEGDVASATGSFQEAERMARESNDRFTEGVSHYDLAQVQAAQGKFEDAGAAYVRAIEAARKSGDKNLEQDARKNLELLLKQQQNQQKQKQDQQSQDQNKEGPDKQDQQGQSGQDKPDQNQKPQGGNSDQDKKSQEKSKEVEDPSKSRQRFKSKAMTPDDAERVMQELSSKERQLKQKLGNKDKPKTEKGDKDW